MKYQKITTTSEDKSFENVRFQVINYIFRQGDVVLGNPLLSDRLRPTCEKEEYGTVVSEDSFYSFHIGPLKKGQIRKLEIVVGSDSLDILQKNISELKKNNELR